MHPPPPAVPTFYPCILPVSQAGTSTTAIYNFPPLNAGDILTDLFALLQTASTTQVAEVITLEAYATDVRPVDATTARTGIPIIPPITIPGDSQVASSTNNVYTFRVLLPLLFRAAQQGRFITLVIITDTDAIKGYLALGVQRDFRPIKQWQS